MQQLAPAMIALRLTKPYGVILENAPRNPEQVAIRRFDAATKIHARKALRRLNQRVGLEHSAFKFLIPPRQNIQDRHFKNHLRILSDVSLGSEPSIYLVPTITCQSQKGKATPGPPLLIQSDSPFLLLRLNKEVRPRRYKRNSAIRHWNAPMEH